MLLDEALRLQDQALFATLAERFRRHVEVAEDRVYGGVFRYGNHPSCSLGSTGPTGKPKTFAVHDGSKRIENCANLFEGTAIDWPPD